MHERCIVFRSGLCSCSVPDRVFCSKVFTFAAVICNRRCR
uniref:Uncharacterized protein n=1 Tax=Arundo donax TaxID=35708 RepID=A0A0A9B4J8_ARUDO